MFISEVKRRVIYAETDKMGYLYYGNYPMYYEVGRVEALRELGTSYRALEDTGILMPVISLEIKYIMPAYYDDLLTITTKVVAPPNVKMLFEYEISDAQGRVINEAATTLVFVDTMSRRPVRPPAWFTILFQPFF